MSLIQEALKRQQQEMEETSSKAASAETSSPGSSGPPAPTQPSVAPASDVQASAREPLARRLSVRHEHAKPFTPTDLESRGETPEESKVPKHAAEHAPRVLGPLLGVSIILVLLIGAAGWAVFFGLEMAGFQIPWKQSQIPPESLVPSEETPSVIRDHGAVSLPPPSPTGPSVAGEDVSEMQKPEDPAGAGNGRPLTSQPLKLSDSQSAGDALPQDSHDADLVDGWEAVEPAPPVAVPSAEHVVWPEVFITGIVGSGQKGAIFINGRVVSVNESIQDVHVLAIQRQGALLEYKGEKRFVKVGQPLKTTIAR